MAHGAELVAGAIASELDIELFSALAIALGAAMTDKQKLNSAD